MITFLDTTDSQNALQSLLFMFLIVGFAMVAVVFLTCFLLASRAIRPIEQAWQKQRCFVADASHELKTPLTVITSNYDALMDNRQETIESQQMWLDYMKSGTDRMAKLIDDLLLLARSESADLKVARAPFDISAAVEEAMCPFDALVSKKAITVTTDIAPGIIGETDKTLILQVFTIIYDNAVKYTNAHGDITVALKKQRQQLVCTVENSGAGIPRADLPRIFDRFYRVDRSRSSKTGGHGLGLSIARTIVEQLGGKISAGSNHGRTVFTMIWTLL